MSKLVAKTTAHVAYITLNQPERRNALDQQMWTELSEHLTACNDDPDVWVVVVRGQGNVFCAGADISEFQTIYANPSAASQANANIARGLKAMDNMTTPSIAVIQGPCMGGGCALASACDIQIADPSAIFGINPTALGTALSFRDCQRLIQRIGVTHTKRMLIGAQRINAEQALTCGLITSLVPTAELDEAVDDLVKSITSRSGTALAATNNILNAIDQGTTQETEALHKEFEACFHSDDFAEGTRAFLAKQAPQFASKRPAK